ncbi:helix-turn-helix transcriptional regulator [Phytohabitans houttuyneae]|uniref:ArsR family transcriptional regulator n=1 Tax=Phytohabitans houttuyneae TaxID=1076126 RepID=A0A6V8KG59_9ACTN|nr:helix-turn-helix domain-containing protein [Phytohabitans houttuyneae]GFJ84222.1 ArsR family transcriptional regulator [Phytohabitans houttuyneae]
MSQDDFDAALSRLAALGEPVRRTLYRYVVAQPEPVSRERAAAGVGVAHHLAKFHLDKLVEDGLLEAEYRRPPGRGGPGAGRPAKLYRRAAGQLAVSLPERRYDLAGHIMAEAITTAGRTGTSVDGALTSAARAAGRELAHPPRDGDGLTAVAEALSGAGFEPRVTDDGVELSNCPFHQLAERYTALVCGMNLDLVGGLLDALPAKDLRAHLAPAPGRCCVAITRARPR